MSNPIILATVGSVGRAWALQILDGNGSPLDLTGMTSPLFSMSLRGSTTRKVDGQAAIIANGTYTLPDGSSATYAPTDGVLIYQPVAADVDTEGEYLGQFTYQVSGSNVIDPGYGYLRVILQRAI